MTPRKAAARATAVLDRSTSAFDTVEPAACRRLLSSALALFSEHGFEVTTTRDISTGAGMSPAALYVHYPSKEDLLFEICRLAHESALEYLRTAMDGVESPRDRVRAWMSEFARFHASNTMLTRVAQYQLGALSPEHRETVNALRREVRRVIRKEIEAGAASGEFHVPDVAAASLAFLSLGIDIARWYTPGERLTPDALADMYGQLALQLLGCR
jgi:AcrR family transcriptional regulator